MNAENGEHTVQDIVERGGSAQFCGGDVSKDADVKRLVGFALSAYGGLDVVVNNAGTTHKNQPMLDVTEEQFDRIYQELDRLVHECADVHYFGENSVQFKTQCGQLAAGLGCLGGVMLVWTGFALAWRRFFGGAPRVT